MLRRFVVTAIVVAALALSPVSRAQTAPAAEAEGGRGGQRGGRRAQAAPAAPGMQNENIHLDGWDRPQRSLEAMGKKPGPTPTHDLSGIWEPIPRYRDGVFASGPKNMPGDATHEAMMPYTAAGKEAMASHKTGFGVNISPITEINDPFDMCDPIGFPRIVLFNLRGGANRPNAQAGADAVPEHTHVPEYLDRWATTTEGNHRAAVVWLFGGEVGGPDHASRNHDWLG
jgi:hypothetical protein